MIDDGWIRFYWDIPEEKHFENMIKINNIEICRPDIYWRKKDDICQFFYFNGFWMIHKDGILPHLKNPEPPPRQKVIFYEKPIFYD